MKKFLPLLLLLLAAIQTTAQAPQAFKYQAVARDLNGNPVINQEISVKISILAGSPEGEVVYSEIHQTTTNSMGLFGLEIGNPTQVLSGSFAEIDWGESSHFLETAIDLTGGGQFQVLGVTQFLSVPYAKYADNGVPDGNNPGDMLYWDGSQWIQVGAGQNGQALIFSNGIPTWGGVQLPILNTSGVTNITAFTAYCGGNIASDGGSPIVGRGICWNTSPNPTTGNFKVFAGSGAGNFLAQMTLLEASTQYFVRAFATNSAGTSYGQEMSFFTTAGAITLTTVAITNITVNSATSGGNITLNGGSPVTARGVCWSTTQFPTIANSKTCNGAGNGAFVSELTSLAANTFYYVRAYATNSLGTSYGQQLSFTTLSGIVSLTTAEVTEITATTAISGGEITDDGGSPVTARGVCYSTSQNPTINNSTTNDGSGNGVFVSNLTGLLLETLYYVRAFATNGVGTYYGNEVSFITLPLIGANYGGGKIAYIFQTGDAGYIDGEIHGLIAAPSDQSTGAPWGCFNNIIYGANGIAIGTGNQNTIEIEAGCTTAGIAAHICANLTLGDFSDWFLPSKYELNTLYYARVAIGGFASAYYWSSSQYDAGTAWEQSFSNGSQQAKNRTSNYYVRAVRAF